MNKTLGKTLIWSVVIISVVYPLWVWYDGANMEWDKVAMFEVFPAFGILAFVLMWQHIVGAPIKDWLNKYVDWKRFSRITTEIVFVSIILHPLLMYVAFWLNGGGNPMDYVAPGEQHLITVAVVGLLMLLSFDVFRHFKGYEFVDRHWPKVLVISTAGFFFILFHSLGIGRDLQEGALRGLWIFYGVSAAVSAIYYYGFKKRNA